MRALNGLAYAIALLLAAGEIARFWNSDRFFPMALDEMLVALALAWAAWRARHDGAAWHLAAWGGYCGLVLVLLIETADHQIHGPPKAAGSFYLAALSVMLLIGLWALRRAFRLMRQGSGG
ncbi:hypothetical protein [Sphingosinicella rhizophila]|uniref:Uncharacterized protein n=1 Tax=Sphingosinicella rhizophila TaxID=3050082 RepID=A0ABU3Q6U4_9SPHN|nr:hypothetical protein [Sphingosinicella sp. GR2756]MDT9599120.1 hypothetical protein [Sphingosinicella sp. GR2756]